MAPFANNKLFEDLLKVSKLNQESSELSLASIRLRVLFNGTCKVPEELNILHLSDDFKLESSTKTLTIAKRKNRNKCHQSASILCAFLMRLRAALGRKFLCKTLHFLFGKIRQNMKFSSLIKTRS